jgi:mono/diheme cytochrome c family protein
MLIAALVLASLGAACRSTPREPAAGGRGLYLRYCTSCHGADAKGHGPVAASLKSPPPDLTQIAKRAGGTFDEAAVLAYIDGRRAVAAHGPRDMPVWGAVFGAELEGAPYAEYVTLLESRALMDHLRSLQER